MVSVLAISGGFPQAILESSSLCYTLTALLKLLSLPSEPSSLQVAGLGTNPFATEF